MKQKADRKSNNSGNVFRTILREELRHFATKDDLRNFATKKDLTKFATKDDLKNFATKRELREEIQVVNARMDLKFDEFEHRIDEKARQYRDEVLNSNDGLAKKLETYYQEIELGNLQTKRQVQSHEQRITGLESAQKN
jgi:hypothetical protein